MFHYNSPSILPQDDYYGYITNDWVKNMEKYIKTHNTYYVKQDDVRIIQADVCTTLVKLTHDYVEKSKDKRVERVYTSFKECHSSLLKGHIRQTITDLDAVLNGQFMDLLVYLNKTPIVNESAPITWTMVSCARPCRRRWNGSGGIILRTELVLIKDRSWARSISRRLMYGGYSRLS